MLPPVDLSPETPVVTMKLLFSSQLIFFPGVCFYSSVIEGLGLISFPVSFFVRPLFYAKEMIPPFYLVCPLLAASNLPQISYVSFLSVIFSCSGDQIVLHNFLPSGLLFFDAAFHSSGERFFEILIMLSALEAIPPPLPT